MLLRHLTENQKSAVFAFGRLNPPTIGHKKLVDKIKSIPGDHFPFLSHTQKPATDPLTHQQKVSFAQKSFGADITIGSDGVRTIIDAMKKLESLGYTKIVYVAGSDRVKSFDELLKKYNGVEYNFDIIEIVNAGERDPDAEGAEGMSASKMRYHANKGEFDEFKDGVAGDEKLAKDMYDAVRSGMGISEQDLDELVVKQQKPKLDVLNNISSRKDNEPFPLSWNANPDEITVGGKIFIAPDQANRFLRFYDGQEKENQELMQKALRSAKTTANLFKNLGIKFDWKQDENFADGKNPGDKGSLKAKVKGKVTLSKAKKLKSKKNATPRDKQLANWFINMHKGKKKKK